MTSGTFFSFFFLFFFFLQVGKEGKTFTTVDKNPLIVLSEGLGWPHTSYEAQVSVACFKIKKGLLG